MIPSVSQRADLNWIGEDGDRCYVKNEGLLHRWVTGTWFAVMKMRWVRTRADLYQLGASEIIANERIFVADSGEIALCDGERWLFDEDYNKRPEETVAQQDSMITITITTNTGTLTITLPLGLRVRVNDDEFEVSEL
jgi:hypothetical protein